MSSNYMCISCRVGFYNAETHRQHYKTDWHRYNLKRKVANFPPVSSEEFVRRILQQKEENELKDTSTYCKACKKTFSCKKAFDNHLNSKKHIGAISNFENSANEEDAMYFPVNQKKYRRGESKELQSESITEEDYSDIENIDSISLKKDRMTKVKDVQNQSHIGNEFSDIEDIDSENWEDDDEVGEISEDNPILKNNCLFCSHHSSSMTKNLKHMSKEHSFFVPDVDYVVDLRNLLLYLGQKVSKFFMCLWCNTMKNSMDAAQSHMRDKGHCRVLHEGHLLPEFYAFYNYSKSYPDHAECMDVDEVVDIPEIDTNGVYELTLPSGGTVGHRSLLAYYRQHYNSDRPVLFKRNNINNVISSYRAISWVKTDKAVSIRQAKGLEYCNEVQSKMAMRLGVKSNKLQEHFKPQFGLF